MGDDVSILSLMGRLVFSLGIVLILMVLLARVLKGRFVPGAARKGSRARLSHLEVVARQGLGRSASVTVVRAGEQYLVLGVTDQQVSLLTEQDAPPEELAEPQEQRTPWTASFGGPAPGPSWREMMERLRDRTARRS